MRTLEALQRDLDTAADLQAIVRTMKVLAAVSIRQYERALESLGDYQLTVEMGLQVALRDRPPAFPFGKRIEPRIGAIVFGSDHGLCGRFNEHLAGFASEKLAGADDKPRILTVGARMEASLKERGLDADAGFFAPGSVSGITATVQDILLQVDGWRQQGINRVMLFYNEHRQRASYTPQMQVLWPVDFIAFSRLNVKPWPSRSLPMFTLDGGELLSFLIRQHLFIRLFNALAESLAGEHASRLAAMQIAEKNIKERLEALNAAHRQQRQNKITEELLDVVSGFEALEGEGD